jgi:carbon storage regulator
MLVLTRKKMESIRIGSDIVVTVVQTGRGRVKLGIEAPIRMRVLRGELAMVEPGFTGINERGGCGSAAQPWELVHEFGNN